MSGTKIEFTDGELKMLKSAMDQWAWSAISTYQKFNITAVETVETNLSALKKIINAIENNKDESK